VSEHIVFAAHDLVTDRSFNEFHVIFCRNVMIYFSRALQDDVHRLFYDSLITFGVLALGAKESIKFSPHESSFEELDAGERLYKKVN
jgi:chemotaxis protein methyltransferase CheR